MFNKSELMIINEALAYYIYYVTQPEQESCGLYHNKRMFHRYRKVLDKVKEQLN